MSSGGLSHCHSDNLSRQHYDNLSRRYSDYVIVTYILIAQITNDHVIIM